MVSYHVWTILQLLSSVFHSILFSWFLAFVFSPAVLSHCATQPCATPRTQTLPSPSWLDNKDKAKGCAACWSHHLFLCSKGRNEHQQTPSLSAWISVLLQDTYLSLTVWPSGCWRVDLLRAVPSVAFPGRRPRCRGRAGRAPQGDDVFV